jgi:hypothetical protein
MCHRALSIVSLGTVSAGTDPDCPISGVRDTGTR